MINYKYLAELPFCGKIRNDWAVDGMTAVQQESDATIIDDYSIFVMNGKDTGLARHLTMIDDSTDSLDEIR